MRFRVSARNKQPGAWASPYSPSRGILTDQAKRECEHEQHRDCDDHPGAQPADAGHMITLATRSCCWQLRRSNPLPTSAQSGYHIAGVVVVRESVMSMCIGRFRCPSFRILGGIVSIALLILNHTFVFGQEANTYRCSVKDAVTLQNNGSLGKDWNTELERKYHDGFIIDTLTGAITWPEYGGRSIWRKIQNGKTGNDYVFSPPLPTANAKRGSAYAASDFILVRAWIDHLPVKFVVWRNGTLLTGTCEIVR